MKFDICIDVDNVARAVEFYPRGLGFKVGEEHPDWAHLKVDDQTFWIMKIPGGPQGDISRDYRRHWTPVHLDLQVDDLEASVQRALAAGGKLDREIQRGKANLANLPDPAGNGIDLVEKPKG